MTERVELKVERLAYRGAGVARREGLVYFVPGTAPGERVVAEVTRCHKNYKEARVVEILEASPERIARCCTLASGEELPGAVYDHLRYEAEVRAKAEQLSDALNRKAQNPVEVTAVASPRELHYRNKMVLHVGPDKAGKRRLGYWTEDRSRIVEITACPLSRGEMNAALAAFRAGPGFAALGERDTMTVRWTERDGALWWMNNEVAGFLAETGDMKVARNGFFQVNPEVAALLTEQVTDWFVAGRGEAPRVLDLYCGVGVFGIACGKRGAQEVTGVEVSEDAVACARENAAHHDVQAQFSALDIERNAARLLGKRQCAGTTVIIDPPRRGLSPEVCKALCNSGAPRIIYVSCDPATLGRDLQHLIAAGYRMRDARMFDMFPRTAHFESAVELTKG